MSTGQRVHNEYRTRVFNTQSRLDWLDSVRLNRYQRREVVSRNALPSLPSPSRFAENL